MPKSKFINRICGIISHKIVAVSNYIKHHIAKMGVNPEKITVVYNGIPLAQKSTPAKEKKNITFVHIGQFVPWKKHLLFIEAAEKLLSQNFNVDFLIVGDDVFGRDSEYKKMLLARLHDSPFKDKFRLPGWQDNLYDVWNQASVLIHTAETEPFGRVIIEAMSNHIPVIASDSAGPAEIIQDRVTGLLFSQGSVEDLAAKMQEITANSMLSDIIADNAHKHVCENFSSENAGHQICNIYKSYLDTAIKLSAEPELCRKD